MAWLYRVNTKQLFLIGIIGFQRNTQAAPAIKIIMTTSVLNRKAPFLKVLIPLVGLSITPKQVVGH